MSQRWVSVAAWLLILLASVGVSGYAFAGYTTKPLGELVHPEMRAAWEARPVAVYTHIFASLVALASGPVQFSERLRNTRRQLHRAVGRIYLLAILLGGSSGLVIATTAFGGLVSRAGFFLLGLLWILSGGLALLAIMRGDIRAHRAWMVRNFALTFAAVTLRIYLGLFFAAGVAFEIFYPLLAWICWVPNILFVEWTGLVRGSEVPDGSFADDEV